MSKKKHPWQDSYSNEIDPEVLNSLRKVLSGLRGTKKNMTEHEMHDKVILAVAEKVGWDKMCHSTGEACDTSCENYDNGECGAILDVAPCIPELADKCKAWMAEDGSKMDEFAFRLQQVMINRLGYEVGRVYALIRSTDEEYVMAFYEAFCRRMDYEKEGGE